jgi:uncharacterized protein
LESSIYLQTSTGRIAGSLLKPSKANNPPVILIIAGSGPTDRDGNSALCAGKNDSLKLLALALEKGGIASIRYDKRGVGESLAATTIEANLSFETYVNDAIQWLELLSKDTRFSHVSIIGHSEGALIGMLAAKAHPIRSFTAIASPAKNGAVILRMQLTRQLTGALLTRNNEILDSLEKAIPINDVPPDLAVLYRLSVQPYLISWFNHVPAKVFAELRTNLLILQGDTDMQVATAEAFELKAANPVAQLHIVQGMNHVLKLVPLDDEKQSSSYDDPSLPIAPDLINTLVTFLSALR